MSGETDVQADLRRDSYEDRRDLLRARYSQEASAIRAPQLINAGGAVALLAFLGQTWTTAPELRIAAVISIALMVLGMLLAVWGQFQLPELSERRYLKNQSSDALKNYREAQQWHQRRVCLAFVSFALAVIVLLAWAAAVNSLRAAVC